MFSLTADKENNDQLGNRVHRSKFSDLLSSAKTDVLLDTDKAMAKMIQKEEAISLSNEWVQEILDKKLSEKLQKDIQAEEKLQEARAIKIGEEEALRIAIEERRRIKNETDMRKLQEFKDTEFAKATVLEDINDQAKMKELCSFDEDYAKKFAKELQDELFAEEIQRLEEEQQEQRRREQDAILDADSKLAREIEEQLTKESRDEKEIANLRDLQLAQRLQAVVDAKSEQENQESIREDAALAKKMSMKLEREEHRRQKRVQLALSSKNFMDLACVVDTWVSAEAEVEDVAGGICITIVLPFLQSIDLKVIGKKRNKIELDVHRTLFKEEQGQCSKHKSADESTSFAAEFAIDGAQDILNRDVSYDYSSESGILHIYVDNFRLDSSESGEKKSSGVLAGIRRSFCRFFSYGKK